MPVCSIYSSVYKPFIKEHNDLTPLFLFSEQTLLSVTTLVCSLNPTQLQCHTWDWNNVPSLYPEVFASIYIETVSSPHALPTLDSTILKMQFLNSPRPTNETIWIKYFILCEWLIPRTSSPFSWAGSKEKVNWVHWELQARSTLGNTACFSLF